MPQFALSYDPNSPSERAVALPSAPLVTISETEVLQPPLTRRGTGPGLILLLPHPNLLSQNDNKSLDPEPIQKWAEEGFAVVGVTPSSAPEWSFKDSLEKSISSLLDLKELDMRDKFAMIVYDATLLPLILPALSAEPRIVALVLYAASLPSDNLTLPTLVHLSSQSKPANAPAVTSHIYPCKSPYFVLPQLTEYHPGSAALAHSRSLVFLRSWLGGPLFDLEAIWDEHSYFEFEDRSVAKTMGTMVAEPYVNHVPTMTGGIGRKELTAFYRDHFIFSNPADASLQTISRTVGPDRVVDEFIYNVTHDKVIDWLLPGVPPSGRKLAIPMMAVVNIRGDRLYNEHIWWDHATALRQAGVLPTYLPYPPPQGNLYLRLPVVGPEGAAKLADETSGKSNVMFGSDWGLQEAQG